MIIRLSERDMKFKDEIAKLWMENMNLKLINPLNMVVYPYLIGYFTIEDRTIDNSLKKKKSSFAIITALQAGIVLLILVKMCCGYCLNGNYNIC